MRQDPNSHHLGIDHSGLDASFVHDPSFGSWTCSGGPRDGAECEPTDPTSCDEGICHSVALYLDVEVVQPQPPYHGRRTPASVRLGGELYWTADLVRSVESLRQTVLDTRTLLSWMLRGDRRPVGIMGLSLGGALAAILTCVEPRFAFSIPLIAHMDLDALVADAPVLRGTRRDLRRFGWRRQDFARFVADLGWYDLRPQLPPDRIHLFAASDDRFFDPEIVRKMWHDWGKPAIRWYPSSHMGFLPHPPNVFAIVRTFINGLSAR